MSSTRTADRTQSRAEDMAEPDHGQGQLPANFEPQREQPRRQSPAAMQRERVDAFMASLNTRMSDILPGLKAARVDPDVFIAGVRRAFTREPKLLECAPATVIMACMDCARVGLTPDGKRAAIVWFKSTKNNRLEATLIIMYEGMLEVIYRAGVITAVHAQVIYEGEDKDGMLDYDLGDEPWVKFKPPLTRDDTKTIIGAFARASSKDGGKWVELMGAKELAKVAKVNKAQNGPGKNWPGEMARKAPLRRLAKFLPKSVELQVLMEIDDKAYLGEIESPAPAVAARAMPDAALLSDAAYTPPVETEDEELPQDDADAGGEPEGDAPPPETDDADPVATMEAMLNGAADDVELLEERYDMIRNDPDWGWKQLSEIAQSRVAMLVENLREAHEGEAPALIICDRDGKSPKTFHNGDVWRSAMLAKISLPKTPQLEKWWAANLPNVRQAADLSEAHARSVLAAAAAKAYDGVGELIEELNARG